MITNSTKRPSRPAERPDLNDRGHGSQSRKAVRRTMTRGGYQLWVRCPWGPGAMTEGTTDTALHRMTDKSSSRLQCRHGWHSSATPYPVATRPEDHDDNQYRTRTRRRRSLQAKLARTSLRPTTLRSGEPPLCMSPGPKLFIRTARAQRYTHPLPLHSFTILVGLLELLFGQPFA